MQINLRRQFCMLWEVIEHDLPVPWFAVQGVGNDELFAGKSQNVRSKCTGHAFLIQNVACERNVALQGKLMLDKIMLVRAHPVGNVSFHGAFIDSKG